MLASQLILWVVVFSVWDFYLANLRPVALIISFISISYLFLYTGLNISFFSILLIASIHLVTSYSGITYFQHKDKFVEEVIYTLTFIISAGFVAWQARYVSDKIRRAASTDELTKLMNRRVFIKRLSEEYIRATRYTYDTSLLMIDIDHFKQVNDQFGHNVGDDVLVFLADLLKHNLRTTDYACRWGGEEFLVLFPHTSQAEALVISKRILSECNNSKIIALKQTLKITFSGGVTAINQHQSFNDAIIAADQCLYQAKDQGRNQIICLSD